MSNPAKALPLIWPKPFGAIVRFFQIEDPEYGPDYLIDGFGPHINQCFATWKGNDKAKY
jgi:hypothetical protein